MSSCHGNDNGEDCRSRTRWNTNFAAALLIEIGSIISGGVNMPCGPINGTLRPPLLESLFQPIFRHQSAACGNLAPEPVERGVLDFLIRDPVELQGLTSFRNPRREIRSPSPMI